MKVGIKKALVDLDRFLLAAACFFIATKVTSQHCKPESILEFYHENRPLTKTFEVQPFEQIKFDLAFAFHKLEVTVYCKLKFEVHQQHFNQASLLPIDHLRKAVKRLRHHWKTHDNQTLELSQDDLD